MSVQYKAPEHFPQCAGMTKVFLAGSIEMGVAEQWQERLWKKLEPMDLIVLNPRRDDWDSTWVQTTENEQFFAQVDWEHSALQSADVIVMYFDDNTKSPITLLELGLFAASGKLVVRCSPNFWRFGNVQYVCQKYNIPLVSSFDEMYSELIIKISGVISL